MIDEWLYRQKFLGGVGLGAYYLYRELEAGIDPLGKPEFGIYQNEEKRAGTDFNAMLDEYYATREWSKEEGRPSE